MSEPTPDPVPDPIADHYVLTFRAAATLCGIPRNTLDLWFRPVQFAGNPLPDGHVMCTTCVEALAALNA